MNSETAGNKCVFITKFWGENDKKTIKNLFEANKIDDVWFRDFFVATSAFNIFIF